MDDARWMASALMLARRSLGRTSPNPAVACILVQNRRLIGRGVTAPGGRPHAEVKALDQARRLQRATAGATAYVTLEPCAHHGRTPPCSQALIDAGISRVVCPIEDPDPRVSGRGFAALRAAGIDVETGRMADQARRVNEGFLSRILDNRPHVLLKLATTLDGRIATRTGESRWITGTAARRAVHLMRAQTDAILIGAGTARTDDPMLDVRGMGLVERSPTRIIADPSLSLPLTGRIAASARQHPTWILHREEAAPERLETFRNLGIVTLATPMAGERLDMTAVMNDLAARGVTRLMCEGGGRLAASLLSAELVDELALFSAGRIIGGDGTPGVRGFAVEHLSEAPTLGLDRIETLDGDVLSIWRRKKPDC